MKRFWYVAMVAVVCLAGCSETVQEKEIIRPVRIQQVVESGLNRALTFSGVSRSGTEAKLSFRINGTVTRVGVKVGDTVKKGSLIATVDASDAKLQLAQARASKENARIQLDTAKSNLLRIRQLYENNNVSLSEYETAKTNYAAAEAAFQADSRQVELQNREISYYQLYSPMDGIVTAVSIEANENVSMGQVVAELNAGDEIEVKVGIPESYISQVQSGADVRVVFTSFNQQTFHGIVTEVAYSASQETSTYPVTVKVKDPSSEIRPGMPADVTFELKAASSPDTTPETNATLRVPVHSVSEDQDGHFVYIVTDIADGFGTVRRRSVKIGDMGSNGFKIRDGLVVGDRVVTAGIAKMRDGLKVRVLDQ